MAANPALVTLLSLVFAVLTAVLGLAVRGAVRWARAEDRIADVAQDLAKRVLESDRAHREIVEQMREDRKATNERLTYLERHAWPRASGRA